MKHGCNCPRHVEPKYLVQDGYMVRFDEESGYWLKLPRYKEVWVLDSASLCRNDWKDDPGCAGCPSPRDVKYYEKEKQ